MKKKTFWRYRIGRVAASAFLATFLSTSGAVFEVSNVVAAGETPTPTPISTPISAPISAPTPTPISVSTPVSTSDASTAIELSEASPVSGEVASLGIFKNGVVVVEEKFEVPGPGRYATFAPPSPLHGTFFITSGARVETTATVRDVEIPISEATSIDWTRDFQGRWLRVSLPNEKEARTVRIVPLAKPENGSAPNPDPSAYYSSSSTGSGVLLQSENGETIWLNSSASLSSVAALAEDAALATVVRPKAQLIFDVAATPENVGKPATIRLFYLTRGASWAPQYRVELKDAQTLEIEQSAILVNEWRAFENVPVALFSGYPQIEMQNVLSPMAPGVNLASFFASLTNSSSGENFYRRNGSYMSQQVMTMNAAVGFGGGADGSAMGSAADDSAAFSDGVDVFGQNVGSRTLAKNDRLLFSVAKKSVPFRRVVCWNITDVRDSNGRYLSSANPTIDAPAGVYGRTTSGEVALENSNRFLEPWDALQFRNPFDFPITTGPATVLNGARFLGQNAIFWTNPNEETLLPITKALSVRVRSIENERRFDDNSANAASISENLAFFEPKLAPNYWGKTVNIRGSYYRVAVIDATITFDNRRSEETPVLLSRQFSGVAIPDSFEGFDETPTSATLGDSVDGNYYRVFSPRNELRWTTTLKPNEKRTLKFSYQTLIAQ